MRNLLILWAFIVITSMVGFTWGVAGYLLLNDSGVFTSRSLALQAGRKLIKNEDDEYYIREHYLNRENGSNPTIWDSGCDKNVEYRKYYEPYWKTGFPITF